MAWQIGVDVGGTFTDLLALDPERGVFRVAKVPATPEDQAAVIHFSHAYANPAHEERGAIIEREIWPLRVLTLESEIIRAVRERERGRTPELNGYVHRNVSHYLGRLYQSLRGAGLTNHL